MTALPADLVARARSLPKVLLHEHLDGGLRVATLLDLLRQRGIASPAADADGLAAWFDARAHAGSLVEYLRGFDLTVAAMATPEALARVAQEAAEDARAEGCVLAEFRIAPLLFEPHGVPGAVAVRALLEGLSRSPLPAGPAGLIVCAMRHEDDAQIARAADLAIACRAQAAVRGGAQVVGFDLAGPEAGWPAARHAALLQRVRDAGLGLTLHAGEADAGERVLEAARLGATRVGHGVRLADLLDGPQAPALLAELRTRGLHLEICPTSNLHTGAAASLALHPIHALWRAGLHLSFHTDNRLMSRVDQSTEAARLVQAGFGWDELVQMGLDAAAASFLPAPARAAAQAALDSWAAAQGIAPPQRA
ncbi:MAG TPA: adenosine deaminase family protein [Aquabacterium sp.]|nr:adenosine deaminase family protein [Aquabacterium sp.]HQC94472.1 adenosine deaminase family protein [Aquabacterium sp.]